MEIKKLDAAQREAALALVLRVFLACDAPDYTDAGIASFRAFLSDEAAIGGLEFFGAQEGEKLLGVLATGEQRSHLCLFFVNPRFQRQGIGRALWEYLLQNSDNRRFTVNSSPAAVDFYHALGFADLDTEQLRGGIRYTPMQFER